MGQTKEPTSVYVLGFYGGVSDGQRFRVEKKPEPTVIFKVEGATAVAIPLNDPGLPTATYMTVVYDLVDIADSGEYRYVERQMREASKGKDWWFAK